MQTNATGGESTTATVSPTAKQSPTPNESNAEQPLDLSAKPSSNSGTFSMDPKQIFRFVKFKVFFICDYFRLTNRQMAFRHLFCFIAYE